LSKGKCGISPPYISPEQYTDAEFDPRAVDIWAAAVIYVAMRTGRNLWQEATESDTGFAQWMEERSNGKNNAVLDEISTVSTARRFLLYLVSFASNFDIEANPCNVRTGLKP
jgi:serine/threonine protein kinase